MTRRIVDGRMVIETGTRVTARPMTDDENVVWSSIGELKQALDEAARYRFLKTMHNKKRDRILYANPELWDAIIDNAMKEMS